MPSSYQFLLIGTTRDDPWRRVVETALTPLGSLHIAREVDAPSLARQPDHDLIIIDAANVEDANLLVSCIHARKPEIKIVIATASPTWRRARAAFRAGAADYIRKSTNVEEVRSTLQAIIGKAPPLSRG